MRILYIVFVLFFCCPLYGYATIVRGTVTNAKGEALPFASIGVLGTTNGIMANGEGKYAIDLIPGSYSLRCQYIGYETTTKFIQVGNKDTVLDFLLPNQAFEMQAAVVIAKAEDPALRIMRQVIQKRKYHESLIKTLETEIYLKGTLRAMDMPDKIMGVEISKEDLEGMGLDSSGKGVLYLLEQLAHYTYQAPNKFYNRIISVRESGNPNGLGWATMPPIINIYENNVTIMEGASPRGFISPANSNAFHFYNFKLLGSFFEDGRRVSKIQVSPKRKYEPLFTGYVYVVEDEWTFHSVDLMVTHTSQLQMLDTLRLEQSYMRIDKDIWVIQSQVMYPSLSLFGIGFNGSFMTSYRNQKVNEDIDKKLFRDKIISSYDSAANSRATTYWDTLRPVPLENDEIKNYLFSDSLYLVEKAKQDTMKIRKISGISFGGFLAGNPTYRTNKHYFSINSLLSAVNYNTVEGVNLTLVPQWKYSIDSNQTITTSYVHRYGFSNHLYNSVLKLKYQRSGKQNKGIYTAVTLQGGQYVYQLNNVNPISNIMNLAYTLFGGQNYMKLYASRHLKLYGVHSLGNGWSFSGEVGYEQRFSLSNTSLYTFNEQNKIRLSSNQPIELPFFENHKAALVKVGLRYQPGWRYVSYPKYKQPILTKNQPVFTLGYTKGIPGIAGSKTNFDKWNFSMAHSFKMRMLGDLEFILQTGGFLNADYVGIPDMKHLFGNQTILANPYLRSFQLAPYYKYSNTSLAYFEGHVEWKLGGLLTNKIPLFRRLSWHLVGGSNTMFINQRDYYSEVFIGLENIGWKMFRFGRLDFIAGYESGNSRPTLGFRISLGGELWNLLNVNVNKVD